MAISYRIRVHSRARRVLLRFDPRDGLVVTVPPGFNRRRIPALIAERKDWIERVGERIRHHRSQRDPDTAGFRPGRIELPAAQERWTVVYRPRPRRSVGLRESGSTVEMLLPEADGEDLDQRIAGRLQSWLKARARQVLVPRVDALVEMHGIRCGRITIRNQRSRWGSCSTSGSISLNARLLFCSPAACRYVLVHELVHVDRPDHSPAFWRRVAELCPDYRQHMRELKQVWTRLPDWVTAT